MKRSTFHRHGFAWVTGGFFLITLAGHWLFGWVAYLAEQQAHQQAISASSFAIAMSARRSPRKATTAWRPSSTRSCAPSTRAMPIG